MGTQQPDMYKVLQSRKFWAAVVGLVFIFVNAWLNQEQINPDVVTQAIMAIIAAYIGATAWEDTARHKAAGTTTESGRDE